MIQTFRTSRTLKSVTEGDLNGVFQLLEVTNDGATDVDFTPNAMGSGFMGDPIPVKAGTTRTIPLSVYNFKATGAITIVAYRL